MKFHQLFKASLHEPKKLAAFRMLSIGKVIQYIFVFIFLYTCVSFFQFVIGDHTLFQSSPELAEIGETIGFLIYPIAFVLQLVIITSYLFIRISIFAIIGVLLLKLLRRRGEFRFMWRTAAIAATLPILLTMVFEFVPAMQSSSLWIASLVHLLYVWRAAVYYPKQPR
ncbi:4-hydroxy-3-methylbut-2-en-1-yl diphosphate synthase [Sporosarcina sp. P21c]|uniref:DUF1189 family protein n=1 Tax=unclassified Sporosarcina TaxID=2647733 RepID=UPI000C16EEE7|nr:MULTISPECIES: DUF1189 family protein [unclassified Sporosarcina]PIC66964.1 4-hydroxy-3-methylbut-2-en-1-yl diphosphate synthase [Sporosarcina sp. P16a]PIC89464.1 4-hydroxy-3-methylbut-2-en-1-yl diphosphate synthase [Sporosarcina sp. P21c]PIC92416.1 4-hydroxy-3-methylbut-2-en-1-yl diphosphate synthase [Sporosarcina sp. P25]